MKINLTAKQIRLIDFALGAIVEDVEDYLEGSEWRESELYALQDVITGLHAHAQPDDDLEQRCAKAADLICADREDASREDILNYIRQAFGVGTVGLDRKR